LALIVLLAPALGHAQSAADEPGYAIVLATTAAPALLFDLLMAGGLLGTEGVVRKGFAINGLVFGSIATVIGSGLTALFITDTRVKPIWTPLGASLGVVGVTTLVVALYSLIRARPVAPPTDRVRLPDSIPIAPSKPPPSPDLPQLLFGVSPGGGVFFGLSGRL